MMRLDKVTRIMNFLGFKKVYSLILDQQGLFIIMTGNVGGLPKAFDHLGGPLGGGALGGAAATPIVKKFQDELAAGEAKLQGGDLMELSKINKNAFVPRGEISSVEVNYGKQPKLNLVTSQGKFSFVFTCTPEEEVKKLESELKGGANS